MSNIINTADEQAIRAAAAQPHSFVYIDKVLKVKTDGYLVQVTLGWRTPNDSYAPVATVSIAAPFAKELADVLLEAHKQAAEERKRE